jgi:hypothetical protein
VNLVRLASVVHGEPFSDTRRSRQIVRQIGAVNNPRGSYRHASASTT